MRDPTLSSAASALLWLLSSGCSDGESRSAPERAAAQPYPDTGVTRRFSLTIEDNVPWEVGPYAIYDGITYNRQIPGPTLEATAGDRVEIELTNLAGAPHSIHTHVSEFGLESDGAAVDSLVQPGQTRTYAWRVRYPGTYPYHDHGDEAQGIARGLFGAVIVHAPDEAKAREQLVVLSDLDQASFQQLPGVANPLTGEFPPGGTYHGGHQYMHTINGKAYEDAVPPFRAKRGELVRWRVVSIGQEFHTWHIHGHRWLDPANGSLTDNIALGPGMSSTFEFEEDSPGNWLVHCHVPTHMEGGMLANYIVE